MKMYLDFGDNVEKENQFVDWVNNRLEKGMVLLNDKGVIITHSAFLIETTTALQHNRRLRKMMETLIAQGMMRITSVRDFADAAFSVGRQWIDSVYFLDFPNELDYIACKLLFMEYMKEVYD